MHTNIFKSDLVKSAHFVGKYDFPMLKMTESIPAEIVPFDSVNKNDTKKWIHFYIDDCKFERIWTYPNKYKELFKKFSGIIGPDFSVYIDMPVAQQIWNTYRNRAISHYLQENGIDVIPNVQWGDEHSYEYCFDGLPVGGTVAISTNGAISENLERLYFKKGLAKMLSVIKPKTVINYGSMPDDIFADFKTATQFIHYAHYQDVIRGRCRDNG